MAICNPLSSNDLRVANSRVPSVYFRRTGRAARSRTASLGRKGKCATSENLLRSSTALGGGACSDDSVGQGNAAAQHPAGAVTEETL
jgi:hypothetical protein